MDLKRVGVVGGGAMGHGIAQITAQAGFEVTISEVSNDRLESALATVRKGLDRLESKGKIGAGEAGTIFDRIGGTTDFSDFAGCGLVIEAVTEELETKLDVWRRLDPVLGADAVRATNTSSLSVIEQAASSEHPGQFIGLHFFNPPQVMNLLEVIRSIETSDETVATAMEFGRALGKDIVEVPDLAGFLVNRLLLPYSMEAIRVLEAGYGTVAEIDLGMMSGAGHPMGPLTLLDYVGLDTAMSMTETMFTEYSDPRFAAPPLLRKLVTAGNFGRKSGRGFYDYSGDVPQPRPLGPKPIKK